MHRRCGTLNATIDQMRRNLFELQARLNELSAGSRGDPERQRSHILASLELNGCRGGRAETAANLEDDRDRHRSLYDRLFDRQDRYRAIQEMENARRKGIGETESSIDEREEPRDTASDEAPGTRLRTLCVRTCDGYFFPISTQATRFDFPRDQQSCERLCPGADVQLYYHAFPEQESSAMVSASTGAPYTELPNAFLYKRTDAARPAQCGCNMATTKSFSILAGESRDDGAVEARRPARDGESPQQTLGKSIETIKTRKDEAIASLDGELRRGIDATAPEAAAGAASSEGERHVRVVGPAFLPDPGEAIDLRDPGRTRDR